MDAGRGKCRRIINAVTDHKVAFSVFCATGDFVCLVCWRKRAFQSRMPSVSVLAILSPADPPT